MRNFLKKYWPGLAVTAFAFWYAWDLIWLKRFLNHPEYVDYYPPYRHWFLNQIRSGQFPIWNPYWGMGHSSEIEASFPLDLYSLFEVVIGPRYHFILGIQAALILGASLYALRILGLSRRLSLLGAVLFILSPWVSYFYLYFIKASSFIGLWLSVAALYAYFKQPSLKRGLVLTAVTLFTMLGTKLEFWFFHFSFLILFAGFAYYRYRFPTRELARAGLFLFLGVAGQLWQIVPLWQILQASHRLENPPGIAALASTEIYRNLWAASFRPGAIVECVQGLASPFGLGALLTLLFFLRQKTVRQTLSAAIFFLPLAYYWTRPAPGDLNELTILQQSPATLRFIWGGLLVTAAFAVSDLRRAKLAWSLLVAVFLLRNQGQILLSYLFGIQWIPSRDNYLLDFSLVWLAVLGLSRLSSRVQAISAVTIPLVLVFSLGRNPFYMHPLMADVPANYPRVEGDAKLTEILSALNVPSGQAVYFADREAAADLRMYGAALWSKTRQVHLFSSLIPRNFRQWSALQWFGIPPEANWSAYEGEYSPRTISRLPFRNTLGLETNRVYWHALHAMPPPGIQALRLVGVRYVLSTETLPEFDGFRFRTEKAGYQIYEVDRALPPAFLLPDSSPLHSLTPPTLTPESYDVVSGIRETESQTYSVTTREPRWLVTQDLAHPFWRARLNGVVVPTETAFGLLRAIRLPPGNWQVEWAAEIPGFRAAVWLSLFALTVFLGLAVYVTLQPIAAFKLEIEYA